MGKNWFGTLLLFLLFLQSNGQSFELGIGAVAQPQWFMRSDILTMPHIGYSIKNYNFKIGALIPVHTPESFAQFNGGFIKTCMFLSKEQRIRPCIGLSTFFKNYRQNWRKDFVLSGSNYTYDYDGLFRTLSLNLNSGFLFKLSNSFNLGFDWHFGIEYYKNETIFKEINKDQRTINTTGNIFRKSRPSNLISLNLTYSIALND
jgi:hypothetical protein